MALAVSACTGGTAILTKQVEARRLAASLHVEFSKANEAANRAVMADTDEASVAAAREATQAADAAERSLDQLQPILRSLGYDDEITSLDGFRNRFIEYRKLDAEILPLAVENTNLKAQRLSFGPGQEAADAFAAALASTSGSSSADVDALEAAARAAVLGIQVIQARHIAEADDNTMSRMEKQMAASEAAARDALGRLRTRLPATAAPRLAEATDALGRFLTINREIVELSRRNSNVRSLAFTLGRKRMVAAEAEDQLRMLEEALGKHAFTATR